MTKKKFILSHNCGVIIMEIPQIINYSVDYFLFLENIYVELLLLS